MPYNPSYSELRRRAREMRNNPTEAEEALWHALRRKQVGGFRFRRQHIIGRLIVDFYCPKSNLVVEVDGLIHAKQKAYDDERTRWLADKGLAVIRFDNEQVLAEIGEVLNTIRTVCEQRTCKI